MPKRLKIPYYAKVEAQKGLLLRKKYGGGLTKQEASLLGIDSGVERAKQLLRNKYLYEDDAKKTARFWARFRNRRTMRSKVAILLWGGQRWGKLLYKIYYS